jgi:hypothetical protein
VKELDLPWTKLKVGGGVTIDWTPSVIGKKTGLMGEWTDRIPYFTWNFTASTLKQSL